MIRLSLRSLFATTSRVVGHSRVWHEVTSWALRPITCSASLKHPEMPNSGSFIWPLDPRYKNTLNIKYLGQESQSFLRVEGGYIEYGNIEKCSGWLNRNHSDGNIKFNFENGNIYIKTGSNGVKRGHSIPYHHQRSPPTHPTHGGPRLTPRLTPFYCRCYRFRS